MAAIRIWNWSRFLSPYTAAAVIGQTPSRAGVYVLWANRRGTEWECQYVGRAANLQRRLLEHLAVGEPQASTTGGPEGAFCWLEIPDEAEREGIEAYLSHVLAPDVQPVRLPRGAEPLRVPLPPRPARALPRTMG